MPVVDERCREDAVVAACGGGPVVLFSSAFEVTLLPSKCKRKERKHLDASRTFILTQLLYCCAFAKFIKISFFKINVN